VPDRPGRVVQYEAQATADLRCWVDTNRRVALRLLDLIEAARRDPFVGLGKPEPLRHVGPNIWSRRLTDEHRLVYRVEGDRIVLLRARGHYGD
jgi:toxin YoeB